MLGVTVLRNGVPVAYSVRVIGTTATFTLGEVCIAGDSLNITYPSDTTAWPHDWPTSIDLCRTIRDEIWDQYNWFRRIEKRVDPLVLGVGKLLRASIMRRPTGLSSVQRRAKKRRAFLHSLRES